MKHKFMTHTLYRCLQLVPDLKLGEVFKEVKLMARGQNEQEPNSTLSTGCPL
jgi:hypothetical protein